MGVKITTNNKLTVTDAAAISLTGQCTLSVLVNPTSLPSGGGLANLLGKFDYNGLGGGSSITSGYNLDLRDVSGTQKIALLYGVGGTPGSKSLEATHTLTTGAWAWVTGIIDGTNITLYVGTTQIGQAAHGGYYPYDNSKLLNIGAFGYYTATSSDLGRYLNGIIGDVRIWSAALTTEELAALVRSHGRWHRPANCGLWLRAEGPDGATIGAAADRSGNGLSVSVVGSPTFAGAAVRLF